MMTASINDWWNAMSTGSQFFYAIALVATFVLLLQMVMMIAGMNGGGDLDADTDFDSDGGHHGDFGIFSIRTIVAFLVGFGWIGVMSLESGVGLFLALIFAGLAGFVLMIVIYWLMKSLSKLKSDGTLNYTNAIGEVGTVYLPIPPRREGAGQVEVMIQGRMVIAPAFTSGAERIGNQAKVRIIDVLGDNSLVVQPVN